MKKKNGFTLIELILVIAILGALSVYAVSRFSNVSIFKTRANADSLMNILRLAQKAASTQRRDVYLEKNGSDFSLCYVSTVPCPSNQKMLSQGKIVTINTGSENIVIPATIKFNALGNTETGKITITVGSKVFYIEEESGYIHD